MSFSLSTQCHMSFTFLNELPSPAEIKQNYPLSDKLKALKKERDAAISAVITGADSRFLVIIGPCSADNEDSVCDYVSRLTSIQEDVADKLILIPRIYTNKPRTTGEGYKGMVHQPDPEKKEDMLQGVIAIRQMHTKAVEMTGLTCADEMLYPENHRYLSDLLSYVAVGARSVEDQQHRLTASGLDIPVGMKNPTSGDLSVMMNSLIAAHASHTFLYRGWEVQTAGNPLSHAILRGYVDSQGHSMPNYHYEDLMHLCELYDQKKLADPAVIVDANHANSGKKYLEQIRICNEVLHSCRHSNDIRKLFKGFMIESYIEDGAQKIGEGVYGKSITDPCLGWEKSEKLIYTIADQL